MKKTYTGGCHCGAVRFEADIDLSLGTLRCNCAICTQTRFWPAIVATDAFRLLEGESELSEQMLDTRNSHYIVCRHCRVRSFGVGHSPETGTTAYGVNVTCLDDADLDDLANSPIRYVDGHRGTWHVARKAIGT